MACFELIVSTAGLYSRRDSLENEQSFLRLCLNAIRSVNMTSTGMWSGPNSSLHRPKSLGLLFDPAWPVGTGNQSTLPGSREYLALRWLHICRLFYIQLKTEIHSLWINDLLCTINEIWACVIAEGQRAIKGCLWVVSPCYVFELRHQKSNQISRHFNRWLEDVPLVFRLPLPIHISIVIEGQTLRIREKENYIGIVLSRGMLLTAVQEFFRPRVTL